MPIRNGTSRFGELAPTRPGAFESVDRFSAPQTRGIDAQLNAGIVSLANGRVDGRGGGQGQATDALIHGDGVALPFSDVNAGIISQGFSRFGLASARQVETRKSFSLGASRDGVADGINPAGWAQWGGLSEAGAASSFVGLARINDAGLNAGAQSGQFWDGSAALVQDFCLLGAKGEIILTRLRASAEQELAREEIRLGRAPVDLESSARPDGWEARIENWILLIQDISRERLISWLMNRAEEPLVGTSALDVETFQRALGALNQALIAEGLPAISISSIHIFKENGVPNPEELDRRGYADLREVGAYHQGGLIHIYAGLVDLLSPQKLVAVVAHEYFAMRRITHEEVAQRVEEITGSVFGQAVLDVDLQAAAKRALRGVLEPDRKGLIRRRIENQKAKSMGQPRVYFFLAAFLTVVTLGVWASGLGSSAGLALLLPIAAGLAAVGAWIWAGQYAAARAGIERLREINGVRIPFDRRNLRFSSLEYDETQERGHWTIRFEDAGGWRVSLIRHPANAAGDRVLEVRWSYGWNADGRESGRFLILSDRELKAKDHLGQAVAADLFSWQLMPYFEQALRAYPIENGGSSHDFLEGEIPDHASAEAELRQFKATLERKSRDNGDPTPYGRWL